jgi:hypothetical protein
MSPDAGPRDDAATPIAVRRSSLRTWTGAAVLVVLAAAACFTVWYRGVYDVMPGQGASGRVHWCGRDYEYEGPPVTRHQAQAQAGFPLHAEGSYPPLALSRDALLAATYPAGLKSPASCATLVFLRTGPDAYKPYDLEGGP